MTRAQIVALKHHCRLAAETMHPRFMSVIENGTLSLCLTVNSGYE